jgi:transposase
VSDPKELPEEVRRLLDQAVLARNTELTRQIEELRAQNAALAKQVEALTRERDKNSSNSSKPPSSDNLSDRRKIRRRKKRTGKKRGGQPGHKGHARKPLPADKIDEIIEHYPDHCEICQQVPPHLAHGKPYVHQVVDLLEDGGGRHVAEHRCYVVACTCGAIVAAPIEKVPSSSFGPRLASVVCALTGNFQLSRRQVVVALAEVLGVSMSLGSVSNIEGRMSKALAAPSDEAMQSAESAAAKHVDETSWIRDFERCSAWVFATALVSVFRIAVDGKRGTLRKLLKRRRGILISDRATVFLYWSMEQRQVCWSHLQRAFIAFSERDGPDSSAAQLGRELTESAELVFVYWRKLQAGAISRAEFVRLVSAVRDGMKPCLERAVAADIPEVSGSCANMLEHWPAMWTFVTTPGVEPTNNHAERELRRLVMWRKRCFGSQSERGDRFVERMMTVTHSLRKQGRDVLAFLHRCLVAQLDRSQPPSLVSLA